MISYKTKDLIAGLNCITANLYEIKEHNGVFEIRVNCNLFSHMVYDNESKAQDRIKRIIISYLD